MTNEGSLEGSLGSLRQFHLTNEGSLEGSLGSLRKFYLTNEGSLGGSLEGSLEGSRHLTCLLALNSRGLLVTLGLLLWSNVS